MGYFDLFGGYGAVTGTIPPVIPWKAYNPSVEANEPFASVRHGVTPQPVSVSLSSIGCLNDVESQKGEAGTVIDHRD